MKILAIETSCDETSVAIVEVSGSRHQPKFRVYEHVVASQVKMHAKFGGVVPNLAKREHQRLLVPLTLRALKKAGMYKNEEQKIKNKKQELKTSKLKKIFEKEPELSAVFEKKILSLAVPDIDVIAVTNGPGLAPALWVGVNFARALALVWKKSVIPVNHMKGHLFSALLQRGKKNDQYQIPNFKLPLLGLLVSGGHTELVLMKKMGSYKIIGETLDDAAGEAFDKVARMMKLGYPGGPKIALEAAKFSAKGGSAFGGKNKKFKNLNITDARKLGLRGIPHGIRVLKSDDTVGVISSARSGLAEYLPAELQGILPEIIKLPRPMISSKDYNFSFSGLKTAVLYALRDMPKGTRMASVIPAMAKEFQDAVADVLVAKTIRAAKEYGVKTIAVGGGVSANHLLRERLSEEVKKQLPDTELFLPPLSLTGDNALMIAIAAALDGKKKAPNQIRAEANVRL